MKQTFAQCDACIFDGVVLIHVEVTLGVDGEVHHSVLSYLLQHVVEEAQSCGDVAVARTVEVHLNIYVSLLGGAFYLGDAVAGKENFGYLVPVHAVFAQYQTLASQVLGQLSVGFTVADDIAVDQVVFWIVNIVGQHAGARLSHGRVVLGEMAVYQLLLEVDSLTFQCLDDEVVHRPESVFREGVGA